MDWWPNDKCDYGDCPWQNASLLTVDLTDPLLLAAVKALAPVALRVGGSLADQVTYHGMPRRSSNAEPDDLRGFRSSTPKFTCACACACARACACACAGTLTCVHVHAHAH